MILKKIKTRIITAVMTIAIAFSATTVCVMPVAAASTTAVGTYVTTSAVNVRSGAGLNCSVVKTLPRGSEVYVVGQASDWSLLSDGTYINSKYLSSKVRAVSTGTWTSAKCDESYYKRGRGNGVSFKYLDFTLASSNNKNYKINDYIISDTGSHYYTIEAASDEGKVAQNLKVGDAVTVDGITFVIDGEVYGNYNTDEAISLWAKTGYSMCIQTCIPPYGGPIVLKYGHVVTNN